MRLPFKRFIAGGVAALAIVAILTFVVLRSGPPATGATVSLLSAKTSVLMR